MRTTRARLSTIVVLALAACSPATRRAPGPCVPPAAAPAAAPAVPNLYEAERLVDAYVQDGRYEADVARVVAEARGWLEERAPAVAKPAIVLDIDETSLSNWPAYRLNGWCRVVRGPCDVEKGPCGLRAWQAMGRSPALAPTVALVQRARDLGVAVFFISGRPPSMRAATERNLKAAGYSWTEVILLPGRAKFASAVDFKGPERRKITERGYTIVLSMGDQDSDLAGGFAERTFKLPNPVYRLP
jgi:acid phosphatase